MTTYDPDMYASCMTEIRRRIRMFNQSAAFCDEVEFPPVANIELCALQLRKILELVAFASLAANKAKYLETRAKFEGDWRLPEILKHIERLNPKFMPVACVDQPPHENSIVGMVDDTGDESLGRAGLVSMHGQLGEILHAKNPYKGKTDYRTIYQDIKNNKMIVEAIIKNHQVWIDHPKIFFLVKFTGDNDNDVQVITFKTMP